MAKIPLVEERAAISTQPPSGLADYSAQAGMWRAVGELSETLGRVGADYFERREKLKREADFADYKTGLQELKTRIEVAKSDALQSGKVHYSRIPDEIVAPIIDEHRQGLFERNYSDAGLTEALGRFELDSASIMHAEVLDRERIETADYVDHLRKAILLSHANGEAEDAERLYNTLVGTIGEAGAGKTISSGIYNSFNQRMAANEQLYFTREIEPDEYLQTLGDMRTEIGEDDLLDVNLKNVLDKTITTKQNNLYHKEMNDTASASKTWRTKQVHGDLEDADNILLRKRMTPEQYDKLIEDMEASLRGKATTNQKVRKSVVAVDEYNKGEISFTQAWRDISNAGGDFAFQAKLWLMAEMEEDVASGEQIKAYESWYLDQKVETTGRMGDFISSMIPHLDEDSTSSEVNKLMKNAAKAIELGPDMTNEEWEKAKTDILGDRAREVIRRLQPPQVYTPPSIAPLGRGRRRPEPEPEVALQFDTIEEAEAANLPSGTIISVGGRRARVD